MTPAGTFKTHMVQTLSSETPKWSPDGSRLVFSMTSQLHVVDIFAMCGLILPSGRAGMYLSCAELRFGGNDLAKRKFMRLAHLPSWLFLRLRQMNPHPHFPQLKPGFV